MEVPDAYSVFKANWVKPVRKINYFLENMNLPKDKFSVYELNEKIAVNRLDTRQDSTGCLTDWKWNVFKRCILHSEYVDFNHKKEIYTIHQSDIEKLFDENDINYHPSEDPWVLKYLIYSEGMHRGEVSEILDVSRSKVDYHTQKYGITEAWKEEDLMKYLYQFQDMSIKQMSELLDCKAGTVSKWLQKHGIRKRQTDGINEERLEKLYSQGLSYNEIGRRLGYSGSKISYWVDKLGLERSEESDPVKYQLAKGYPSWIIEQDGKKKKIRVHRLAAVAKFGIEEVENRSVHHKNGVSWDSSLSNLELMTNAAHAKHHNY